MGAHVCLDFLKCRLQKLYTVWRFEGLHGTKETAHLGDIGVPLSLERNAELGIMDRCYSGPESKPLADVMS
jgi:hypothetical protein